MRIGTQAIVLHSTRFGDTSAIVKMYTRQCGMISFMLKGIHNKKRNKAALIQPLSLIHIEMQLRQNKDLQLLNELRSDAPYSTIPFSMGKTAQVMFIAEVLARTIKEEERNDELFDFLHHSLEYFDQFPHELPDFHLKFLFEFSRFLGFYPVDNFDARNLYFQYTDGVFIPYFNDSCFEAESSEALVRLLRTGFNELHTLNFNRQQRKVLTTSILDYFRWHLPAISNLKTQRVLAEVFDN
jgi:DNA repair protein RecO (recombination protein O)